MIILSISNDTCHSLSSCGLWRGDKSDYFNIKLLLGLDEPTSGCSGWSSGVDSELGMPVGVTRVWSDV